MKLAIMQPYFFPYIGYWQLIHAVDRFVVFDDVNYITRGWINRNRILINGEPRYITVPLREASQNRLIREIVIDTNPAWRNKMSKSVEMAYAKAPYFSSVFPAIEAILRHPAESLSDYLIHQIRILCDLMNIRTEITVASSALQTAHLLGQDRILDICKREHASTYINLSGGKSLYAAASFDEVGIALEFISMQARPYRQNRTAAFIPSLSIIDALMAVGFADIQEYLNAFELSQL